MMLSKQVLASECCVFTQYLLGCAAPPYTIRKYDNAHQVSPVFSSGNRFDRFLVRVAGTHPVLTRVADSYARMLAPQALLRKKLILLLAILETSPPTHNVIDSVGGGSNLALSFRLVGKAVTFGLSAAAGAILFVPARLILAGERKSE
jgi:hypothetical protein